jgi:hypothetical protein
MHVGIYTHYAYCDETHFALRLADMLHQRGVDFSIYPDNQPAKLGITYDRAVVSRQVLKFSQWVKNTSTVVWTHVPRVEQLRYAHKAGATTIVAPMWQDLHKPYKKALATADHVVTMCLEQANLFQDVYNLQRSCFIPFDTGLPITRKDIKTNTERVRVFLPWFDANARCATSELLSGLLYLVERMPSAYLTLGVTASKFSPTIVRLFRKMGEKTGRVQVIKSKEVLNRGKLYLDQDLTIWPGECDNYGLCPLTSITMGTPVITTAVSPQTDFITTDTNGVLLKTRSDYDEHGVVHALPDYEKFIFVLQELIAEPSYIDTLNAKTAYDLPKRRQLFNRGWTELLRL